MQKIMQNRSKFTCSLLIRRQEGPGQNQFDQLIIWLINQFGQANEHKLNYVKSAILVFLYWVDIIALKMTSTSYFYCLFN